MADTKKTISETTSYLETLLRLYFISKESNLYFLEKSLIFFVPSLFLLVKTKR